MGDDRTDAREPVHWEARLVRSEDFHYTEIDGTPLLVRPSDGAVRLLTPTWAAIWVQLDGRPVTEALGADADSLDPVDARNLIEVLRRLKAADVIVDADPSRLPGGADDPADREMARQDVTRQEELHRPVKIPLAGSVSRDPDGITVRVDPSGPDRVVVRMAPTPNGARMSIRRRLRRRRIDHFQVSDARRTGVDPSAIERFVTLIEALEDPRMLGTPGLVDLLAEFAEVAVVPASPPH